MTSAWHREGGGDRDEADDEVEWAWSEGWQRMAALEDDGKVVRRRERRGASQMEESASHDNARKVAVTTVGTAKTTDGMFPRSRENACLVSPSSAAHDLRPVDLRLIYLSAPETTVFEKVSGLYCTPPWRRVYWSPSTCFIRP